jgi:hypothetical protein
MKNYLTVGDLRKLLTTSIEPCDIPDDAPVVVPGSGRHLVLLTAPRVEGADGDPMTGFWEPNVPGKGDCKVLVLGRGIL